MLRSISRLAAALLVVLTVTAAHAADIKVMISAGFFHVYSELGPAFEKATGESPHHHARSLGRRFAGSDPG